MRSSVLPALLFACPVIASTTSITLMRGGVSLVFLMFTTSLPSNAASCAGMSSPDEAAMVPASSNGCATT